MGASPPALVADLVERFSRDRKAFQSPDYKEEQLRDAAFGRQLTAYSLRPSNSKPSAVSRKPMADADRGIEHYAFLQSLMNGERIYPRLVKHFRDATDGSQLTAYSLRLDSDSGRSAVSRWPLALIIGSLYYPDCPYEFSVLPADILGQVYEQFLGKVIRLTAGHQAMVNERSKCHVSTHVPAGLTAAPLSLTQYSPS